ncbi:MAG: hypothetical protein STSR0008_11190 [Ignavibacterium sp.]
MYGGILTTFLFLFCLLNLYPQTVFFFKEKIEVIIEDEDFIVIGDYFFLNKSNQEIKLNLFYPFKINENLSYPDSINVTNKINSHIDFIQEREGILIPLNITPNDTTFFNVYYKQRSSINKAEYILTTTKHWKQPLQSAEYIIKIPEQFILKDISLKPYIEKTEYTYDGNNSSVKLLYQTYLINKKNFMPDTNLIVEWVRRLK